MILITFNLKKVKLQFSVQGKLIHIFYNFFIQFYFIFLIEKKFKLQEFQKPIIQIVRYLKIRNQKLICSRFDSMTKQDQPGLILNQYHKAFSNAGASLNPDQQTPSSTLFNPINKSYQPILHSHPPKNHLERDPYRPPSRNLKYDYPYHKQKTRGRPKQLSGKLDKRFPANKHPLKNSLKIRPSKSKKNSYKQGNVNGSKRVNFTGARGLKKKTITALKTCSMKNTISTFKFEMTGLGVKQMLKGRVDKNARERSMKVMYQGRKGMRRNHTTKVLRPYESFRALGPDFHKNIDGKF